MTEHHWSTTVADAIRDAARLRGAHNGYTFCDPREDDKPYTYGGILEAARARAAALYALGLRKGDRLAMVVPGAEDFVLNFLGAVLGGIVPVPMYPPVALGKVESYVKNVEHIVASSGAKVLLVSKQVRPILGSALDTGAVQKLALVENLDLGASRAGTEPEVKPDDLCFLQYTSGSTSAPKGVRVTHANLAANCFAIMRGALASDGTKDRGLSWLPLYHDMGLIGFVIAPLFDRTPVSFLPTMEFVKRPAYWLEMLHKHKATITFAPNFAYALAARRTRDSELAKWDFSHVRVLGCGAEPIQAGTLRAFIDRFASVGMPTNALLPCYGMAEATLAISFAQTVHHTLKCDTVDAAALRTGDAKPWAAPEGTEVTAESESRPVEIVSCGPPIGGHEVAVFDEAGNRLPERMIGELAIKGPSVTAGYHENPEATAKAFRGEWLYSGDLGYVADGNVYVCGRAKDMLILNGRNYYPQDIEWLVQDVPGVRKGSVVAFSCQPQGAASESLVVVCEWAGKDRPSEDALVAVQKGVTDKVQTELGLNAWKVVVIPPGTVPKTSSGKLQRSKTRDQFERGTLGAEAPTTESLQGKAAVGKQVARSYVTIARHAIFGAKK